jgi:predicted outer membrane repeat protein
MAMMLLNLDGAEAVRAGGGVLYAAPGGSESADCQSWATACSLQRAIFMAVDGNEIWVKKGTHYPGYSQVDSFALKSGVTILGGFNGSEDARDQRDWVANLTTLSGDVDRNDINAVGDNLSGTDSLVAGANALHVITADQWVDRAILDGFTITGGDAASESGAGMHNSYSTNLTLRNLTFVDNHADQPGGGMFNDGSSPQLTNVKFIANSASQGGGLYNMASSNPALTDVVFFDNSADYGGAMRNAASDPLLINVTFHENLAVNFGGAIYNNTSDPVMRNVTFSANTAGSAGGAIYNLSSSGEITNATFHANTTAGNGGGLYMDDHSNPSMINVILWANIPDQIYNYGVNTTPITYSLIQGGYTGQGNISQNPLLSPWRTMADLPRRMPCL